MTKCVSFLAVLTKNVRVMIYIKQPQPEGNMFQGGEHEKTVHDTNFCSDPMRYGRRPGQGSNGRT